MSCSVCCEGAAGRCDCWNDEPDDRDLEDRDDDEPAYPDFGCACENALVVDTTCAACIEWLKAVENEESIKREEERQAREGKTP